MEPSGTPNKVKAVSEGTGRSWIWGRSPQEGAKGKSKLTRVREGEPVGGAGDDSGDSPFSCASTQMCSLAP